MVWDRLIVEIKSPINFISLFLAVLALLLSIYFYIAAKTDNNLHYFMGNTIEIVSRSLPSKTISITRSDGQPILGNVYVTEVTLWAGNDVKTSHSDIRKPLTIKVDGGSIIEASIVKATHAPISKYSFVYQNCSSNDITVSSSVAPTPPPDHLKLYWCVFDGGMGVIISIVYDAAKPAQIFLDGYISGISSIKITPELESNIRRDESGVLRQLLTSIIFLSTVSSTSLIIAMFLGNVFSNHRNYIALTVFLVISACFFYFAAYGAYYLAIEFNVPGVGSNIPTALQKIPIILQGKTE